MTIRWTPEMDQALIAARDAGMSWDSVGDYIGVSPRAAYGRGTLHLGLAGNAVKPSILPRGARWTPERMAALSNAVRLAVPLRDALPAIAALPGAPLELRHLHYQVSNQRHRLPKPSCDRCS